MKKTLLVFLFLSSISFSAVSGLETSCCNNEWMETEFEIQASSSDSYGYMTIGTGPILLIPNLGIGYRQHWMHHGYDLSLSASTFYYAHVVQGSLIYHFYPNPFREDPWYIGIGVTPSLYVENGGGTAGGIAPDFVIGKELSRRGNTKHFIEAHIQAPTWVGTSFKRTERANIPLLFIKYGIGF